MKKLLIFLVLLAGCTKTTEQPKTNTTEQTKTVTQTTTKETTTQTPKASEKITAKISANGDLLYHLPLIHGAKTSSGYDFNFNYEKIKNFISSVDFAIANFEGTVTVGKPYDGYPRFNAPVQVVDAIKNAGYDAITMANNHTIDFGLAGMHSTYNVFNKSGFLVSGYHKNNIPIKVVNGIKIALLAYTENFNGLESSVPSNQQYLLPYLNESKVKKDIEEAEKLADFTIVYPHMGVEYQLTPTPRQKELYHKMVNWGADAVFGNHPHVLQPTEVVEKNGLKKFIIYSMGNLLSNQRIETLPGIQNVKWTERGVIIEMQISKENNQTKIDFVELHPTWVLKRFVNGAAKHTVLMTKDYLNNTNELTANEKQRVINTHKEVLSHLKLPSSIAKR